MNGKLKVLFIAFIDFNGQYSSGSEVRPYRMLEAFKNLGYNVKVLDGASGIRNIRLRKKNVKKIIKWVGKHNIDMCYVEPPSGPFFCAEDLKLLKLLKRRNIPIGLFYRDAYWKFPDFEVSKSLKDKIRFRIVCKMQQRDWKVFWNTCKCIYFPSNLLGSYFVKENILTLPPGCNLEEATEQREDKDIKCAIYVGGATEQYGIFLLLDSFNSINANEIKVRLICVCPKEQWNLMPLRYRQYKKKPWMEIYHLSSGDGLDSVYRKTDFAVIPRLKSPYTDLSMPVKLFEYLSKCKPIISTNCVESAEFIKKNGIGIIVEDNQDSLVNGINEVISNSSKYKMLVENCISVRLKNSWEERVKKVVSDLIEHK